MAVILQGKQCFLPSENRKEGAYHACVTVLGRNGSAGCAWAQQSELSIDSSVLLSNFTQMIFLPSERICVRLQLVV